MTTETIDKNIEGVTGEEVIDVAEFMRGRAQTYGMLARLFRVEVDLDTMRELQHMRFPQSTGNKKINDGLYKMYQFLRTAWEDSVTELAIDYVNTFIGHGINGYSAAYPFESVYTSERRLLMQEARSEVLNAMREQGLKRGEWNEGEDHIALELEFMQRLAIKCADAIDAGRDDESVELCRTQYDFLENHLINWLPMLVADMQNYAKTTFYQGVGELTLGYVEDDELALRELLDSVN